MFFAGGRDMSGAAPVKTIGVLGSCLAGTTAVLLSLDYRWVRINNAAIDRSDVFVRNFVRQAPMPSRDLVEMLLAVKPEHAEAAAPIFERMFRSGVGRLELPPATRPLIDNLANERFDVLLLDNQYDTYNIKATYRSLDGKLDFEFSFPLHWCEHFERTRDQFDFAPRLTPEESARNWAEIVRYLQNAQPQARIFFFCAPSATIEHDADRRARAEAFEPALRAALGAAAVEIVPPLFVPRALTKLPDDPEHFDLPVYRALAGRVFSTVFMRQPADGGADAG